MKPTTSLLLAMVDMALARPSPSPNTGKHYECETYNIPISVANVPTLAVPFTVKDQYEAIDVLATLNNRSPPDWLIHPKLVNVSATYNMAMQYCFPVDQPVSSTLQLLTHGIGFNASYWDFYLPSNPSDAQYSYISAATAAGYATLSYNRLGIDGSGPADPDKEVQPTVELAIMARIIQTAREGKLSEKIPKPSKIVHVGHSFGSILSNALAATAPTLFDGIVLTGYTGDTQYQKGNSAALGFNRASDQNPSRWPAAQYPAGYVTWPNKWSLQLGFFSYPHFDPAVLDHTEAIKAPFSTAEFFAAGLLKFAAPGLVAPVLYVNGEKDLGNCGGNCTGVLGEGTPSWTNFNGSSDIESVIVPGYGHGMNMHYGANKFYDTISEWMKLRGF
ncbi:hypothetical protein PMZ80_009647 [Knufia obscura]|uniref:AB hydrolase-1 domain-containing protein n=2 Tax=Knufia TaxID=430999 RepID=A0AAN8EGP0_9EURO|nr:hypothetical protein PMZ80_009647 [Knufia obscura]KAK5951068.1 hypothetical protein OHC33_007821 [Knufia fluminis]